MAGHSKWANIKYRKEKSDKLKGKLFSRITKEIISSVRIGGPDPKANPRLRVAMQKAKAANLPNENVQRNIKKASSPDQADFIEATYEIYGHGGVGIFVEALTDNKNRTASDMRIATNKKGGNIANPGAVAFNFERKGIIQIPKKDIAEEKLFLDATESGAEDFETAGDLFLITTAPDELFQVKEKLASLGYPIEAAELEMIPKNVVECDPETVKANLELIDWLENLDDVDAVYHNMNLSQYS
ncbi:MAG TPA: YebC/PmpR family DNA-binding transcriptional regulator [Rhabdochlamydiaceae bacterium]|nr:YebC/PmpR family DNA-binding transcriptional regulator [Rhabdochlamydiaceae bacterium]